MDKITKLKTRAIWRSMIQRCSKKTNRSKYYLDKGVRVCERWVKSFDHFLVDMGCRPSPYHQIDRIDNDGPYSPENCRWVTRKQNCRNKSSNVLIEKNGVTKTVVEWCEELNLSTKTVYARVSSGTPTKKLLLPTDRKFDTDLPIIRRGKNTFIDYSGHIFGFFTVVKEIQTKEYKSHNGKKWLCRCECGKEVVKASSHLKRSKQHCGCKDLNRNGSIYARYWDMLSICNNKNRSAYKYYGGKGIVVCDRWLKSPLNFIQDMGTIPEGGRLTRVDKSGNFEPKNCFWKTL